MRILMVIDSLRDGGKERRATELVKGLKAYSDIDCKLILLKDNIHYKEILDLGFEILVFKRAYKRDLSVFGKIHRAIREYNPDIIHSWGSMPSVYCLPSVLFLKKKFINALISNSVCPVMSKNWIRSKITFPFSDIILANSQIGLKAYKVKASKARLIRNGFCLSRLENIPERKVVLEELGLSNRSTDFFIGMVASIDYRKDFPLYVEAANLIVSKYKDVTCLIIGDGPDRPKVEGLVLHQNKEQIVFTGKIEQVEHVISLLDIGVLCTYGEGTSNAILEYMAFQKPVVATNVPGNEELIKEGETGFLIPPKDIDSLTEKLEMLMFDKDLSLKVGRNAKSDIVTNMTNRGMVEQYINLYNEVKQ